LTNGPRLLVDTSVAIPLLVASHEAHDAVASWAAERELCLGGHALVETYSVLTRLPGDARVTPENAVRLIDENFPERLTLPSERAAQVHRELAGHGVSGVAAYDGLVALVARDHGATLATRDARARSTYEKVGAPVVMVG
jgi:predicted nucleic acid-binding protein